MPAAARSLWVAWPRPPVSRLARIVLLAGSAVACQVAAFRGTTPAIAGTAILVFILGLELIEPLSQEIDQADRCDAMPISRGEVHFRLLSGVPAVASLAVIVVASGIGYVFEPRSSTLVVAPLLAIAVIATGMGGASINAVAGAPDPLATSTGQVFMPPEAAGTTTMIKAVWPLLIAAVGVLPVLAVRAAVRNGDAPAGGRRAPSPAWPCSACSCSPGPLPRRDPPLVARSSRTGRQRSPSHEDPPPRNPRDQTVSPNQPAKRKHPQPPSRTRSRPRSAPPWYGEPADRDACRAQGQAPARRGRRQGRQGLRRRGRARPAVAAGRGPPAGRGDRPQRLRQDDVPADGRGPAGAERRHGPSTATRRQPEARRSLSYLADNPTFYEDLSSGSTSNTWPGCTASPTGSSAADLLGDLGLYERADDLPNSFSRGLSQKAAIAIAFVRPFDVLLVDEPFVGLDSPASGRS